MAQVKRDQGLAFLAYTAEVSSAQDELPLPIPIALFSFFFFIPFISVYLKFSQQTL